MLAHLQEVHDQFMSTPTPTRSSFQEFLNTMFPLIAEAEKQFSREEIISQLGGLREELRSGPLFKLSQDWARGYQGDFEIIQYILSNINRAPLNTLAYFGEEILLNGSVCQQHRNKIKKQSDLIKETIAKNPSAKIVSIGCGISEDVLDALDWINDSNAEVTLIDVDRQALEYSVNRLTLISDKIRVMAGNIYRSIIQLSDTYDLILFGGVFDYLSDQIITSVLGRLSQRLSDDGRIFFTNIKTGNPYRFYLEYLSNWILIERTGQQISAFIDQLQLNNISYKIESDQSDVTFLVTLKKDESKFCSEILEDLFITEEQVA